MYQMKLRVKSRDDVEGVFPPSGICRDGRDDHDLVKYEDTVSPAGELEGRLWDHLQVTVVHRQDGSFGEDASQDVQIGRGALYTQPVRKSTLIQSGPSGRELHFVDKELRVALKYEETILWRNS